jgi:hypothetical protein
MNSKNGLRTIYAIIGVRTGPESIVLLPSFFRISPRKGLTLAYRPSAWLSIQSWRTFFALADSS